VRALGIRRVTGSIVGDDSFFDRRRTAPGWKPGFLIEESPPLSALVVDRGRIEGRAVSEPALAAAVVFRKALRRAGIEVDGPVKAARAGGTTLARLASPPLEELLVAVNAESDNYTAELLLKQLGAMIEGHGTSSAGAAVARQVLADHDVPLAGVRIADGSGLSALDRLTARALASILVEAWHDRRLRPHFVPTLALAGRSGTLERRLGTPPTLGNVRAKTGTTDTASALAGYARKRYAFAVIHNGNPVATTAARASQDRIATLLAAP
jgi:PBP4 family serine-type D-alanyl-D-alanine carboxypeptidase